MKPRLDVFNKIYFSLLSFSLLLIGITFYFYPNIPVKSEEVSTILPFEIPLKFESSSPEVMFNFLEVKQDFKYFIEFPDSEIQFFPLFFLGMGFFLSIFGIIHWAKIEKKFLIPGLLIWLIFLIIPFIYENQFMAWIENLPWIWAILSYITSIISFFSIPTIILKFSRGNNWNSSFKNFLLFLGFIILNFLLSFAIELNWIDSFLHIPIILIYLINTLAFLLIINKYLENPQKLIWWGLNFIQIGWIIFQILFQNDSGLKGFLLWNTMSILVGSLLFIPFLYSNFHHLFEKNLPFYRVILKAKTLSPSIIWIGGFLLLITWNFGISNRIWHLFKSGVFNHQGLWEYQIGKNDLAKISFENGFLNSRKNIFSNSHLAKISLEENNFNEAEVFIANSMNTSKSPELGLLLSQFYLEANQPFESLFLLKKLNNSFKNNIQINNQIATTFENLNFYDSSKIFLELNFQLDPENNLIQTNYLGSLIHQFEWQNDKIEKIKTIPLNSNWGLLANHLILGKIYPELPKTNFNLKFQPSLNTDNFAYLNNSILAETIKDYELPLDEWMKNQDWQDLYPETKLLKIIYDFQAGKRLNSFKNLVNLISQSQESQIENLSKLLENFRNILFKENLNSIEINQNNVLTILNKHPFNLNILLKARNLLNNSNQQNIAYNFCFDASNLNPQSDELLIPYILQAYYMGEINYAETSIEKLKTLNPKLFEDYKEEFSKEKSKLLARRKF